MKRNLKDFAYLIVLYLIQSAGLKVFSEGEVWFPSLLLILVLIYTLRNSLSRSLWFSFGAGFLTELFSSAFFGTRIFSFIAITLAVYLVTRKLTTKEINLTVVGFVVVLSTLFFPLFGWLYNVLLLALGAIPNLIFADFYTFNIFWKMLMNLIFFYPVNLYFLFSKDEKTL